MASQLGEVVVTRARDSARLRLTGEFDLSNVQLIREALREVVHDGVGRIVVDLVAVSFLDAQLLHSLLRAREAAAERGIDFSVVPPSDPGVWRAAEIVDFRLAA